ncbi:hypothetical protein FD723_08190 [Nostoc sp. C052]|uniref:hypothetical protein n=1 Tax=Nostoc sp. C052 TaxID=2576902 RepID=UPI0015C3995F|nr:hypothetical protein [Nostoc sp. C052]QLE40435.1 hypothetical protein FD723_08190 [Nostoc sp. C052]
MQQEIEQLKESLKQNQIINALEKSFYATSGKAGKDEDGYSYFDLISDRAINYILLDEHDKFIIIDPHGKTPLKILMAWNQNLNFAIAFLSTATQNPQVWTAVDKNEN